MKPELCEAINKLPDGLRESVRAWFDDAARVREAAMFEDMGYDDCEKCRQARLRAAFSESNGAGLA